MTPLAQASEYKSAEQVRLRSVLRALQASNVSVLYQTADFRYLWAENVPEHWQLPWHSGISEEALMPVETANKLSAAKAKLLATGELQRLEFSFPDKNTLRWYEFFIDSDKAANGDVIGIITTVVEISELKRREQVLKILLREVSHRSKNLLAIIQSIAMQTARYSGSIDYFLKKFRGRLYSLSHSQDLVTELNWHGADLRTLLYSQIEKYIQPKDPRLTVSGTDVYLFPGAALHVGLAFHELIVNCASYGALTSEHGRLSVSSALEPDGEGGMQLVIRWKESCLGQLPAAMAGGTEPDGEQAQPEPISYCARTSRFGSAVLLRIVPQAVGGTACYTINEDNAEYILRIPHCHFEY